MSKVKSIVCLSGGLDSAVLLAQTLAVGMNDKGAVLCVSFNYGSNHAEKEELAVMDLLEHYGVKGVSIDLPKNLLDPQKSSALIGHGKIPEGHYEEESMRQTVVPGRNLLFIAVLASYAESYGAENILLGVHSGDHHIYPDCRPDFLRVARKAVQFSTDGKVQLHAPFQNLTKVQIVDVGRELKVPFEKTWTCYVGGEKACGKCGSCQERLAAFKANDIEDPLEYEAREIFEKGKSPEVSLGGETPQASTDK